ncbi:MAG: enoyl-CoA hydratase-related protein [Thermodesulfobacteriota bacterium]|nr:enoyl-CoA hydratase-related protein [Thermodesulfobacteriota bacterium]
MPFQTMNLQREGHVAIIKIKDSASDDKLMAQLCCDISDICTQITSDETAQVVILTGDSQRSFTIEADLFQSGTGFSKESQLQMYSLATPISRLDRPVIAAIDGEALGPGFELVLACDMRIATERACFGLPHLKKGLIPWDGGTQRLSRLVGRGRAMEMILTGESIGAEDAYRIGLVNRVVHPDVLMKETIDMASQIASRAPNALRYAKEAVCKGIDLTLDQGLRLEGDLYFLLQTTNDRIEGVNAFREKKTPHFKGT